MKYLIASDAHGRSDLLYSAAKLHRDREGLIYLGDGIFLTVSESDGGATYKFLENNETQNLLVSLLAYDRYVILRPSKK